MKGSFCSSQVLEFKFSRPTSPALCSKLIKKTQQDELLVVLSTVTWYRLIPFGRLIKNSTSASVRQTVVDRRIGVDD